MLDFNAWLDSYVNIYTTLLTWIHAFFAEILSCADVQCGQNAECVELSSGNPECRCLTGFYGDGLFCYEPTGVEVGTGEKFPIICFSH